MTAQALTRGWGGQGLWGQASAVLGTNLVQAGIPFCSVLILGRRFGMECAGDYALAQAVTLPVFQFLSLQLKPLLLTRKASEFPLGAALYLRALSSVAGILFAGVAYIFCGGLALLLAGGRLLDSWSELTHAEWQRQGRAEKAFGVSVLRGGLAVGCLLGAGSAEMGLALYLAGSLLLLLLLERPPESGEYVSDGWELLRSGMTLGVVISILSLQAQAPRIALEHWGTRAGLGLFATMTVLLQAGNLVASSYGQSLLPRLGEASVRRIAWWTMLPGAAALVAALPLWWGQEVIAGWLAPQAAREAAALVPYLSAVGMVAWPAATVGCALTAKRLYRPQLWIVSAGSAVAVGASWMLVPGYGASGAAMAMGVAAVVNLVMSFAVLQWGRPE